MRIIYFLINLILLFTSNTVYGQLSKEYIFDDHINQNNQYVFFKVRYFGTFNTSADTFQTVYSTYRYADPVDSVDLHFITYDQDYDLIYQNSLKVDLGNDRLKNIGSVFVYWQGLYYFLYEEYRPEGNNCKDVKIGCIDDSGRLISSRILIDSTYRSNYQDWKLLFDSVTHTFVVNINYIEPGYASWIFTLSGDATDLNEYMLNNIILSEKWFGNIGLDSSILYAVADSVSTYNLKTQAYAKYKTIYISGIPIIYSGSLKVAANRLYVISLKSDTLLDDGNELFRTKIMKISLDEGIVNLEKVIPIFDNKCYLPGVIYDQLSMDNCGNLLYAYSTNNAVRCSYILLRTYTYPNHYGIIASDTNLVLKDTFDFSSGNTLINYKMPLNDSIVVIAGMKVFPDSTYQFVRFININRICEISKHSKAMEQAALVLFPTITQGELQINGAEQTKQDLNIIFYTSDGKECIRKNLTASDAAIDISMLRDGIYLYTILSSKRQILGSGKIIKQQ